MSDVPAVETVPLPSTAPIGFNKDEANYFLHVVDFYRTVIKDVLDKVPPLDLVAVMAFILGALESQLPEAGLAFDEQRKFFKVIYPPFLAGHREAHPEDDVPGDFLMVIPTPLESPGVSNLSDPPRVITKGSALVN